MKQMILGVLSVLLLTAGCGNETSSVKENDMTTEEFVLEYEQLSCEQFMNCSTLPFSDMFTTSDQCVTHFRENGFFDEIETVSEKVRDGLMNFDGVSARDCLSGLSSMGCDMLKVPGPDICDSVSSGTVPNGGSCEINGECEGKWCDTRETCPGECKTRVSDGDTCEAGVVCEHGADCTDGTCITYSAPITENEPCSPDVEWCEDELFCNPETGTCIPLRSENNSCTGEGQCGSGMICHIPEEQNEGTCITYTITEETGGACDYENGIYCNAVLGLYCHLDYETLAGTCQGPKQKDEICLDVAEKMYYTCHESLYCDFTTKKCRDKKELDDVCTEHQECESEFCSEGVCADEEGDRC